MSKLEIILFITATVSLAVCFKACKENSKIRKESKKHKCNLGKMICGEKCCYYCEDRAICRAACNGNPLVCGNSREE